MRSAELVGLTPNGKFIIVATDSGEELAIAADDRLRAALRGDRPRLGMLEIEMESALTPREIQARIRAGEDVAEVARVSGMSLDRVERFAAPVLAERDHIARQAMGSTVRRRGESSAHRNLRPVVDERLQGRGIDTATMRWDSFRHSDGRWVVTATYSSGEAERQAQFSYDPPGRFSVAGNDEAHWILGDSSNSKGPQPGRRRAAPGASEDDTEPTLDLSDELALVRVVQDASEEDGAGEEVETAVGSGRPAVEETIPIPSLRVVESGWEPPIVVNYPLEPGPAEDASDEPGRPDLPTDLDDRLDEEEEFEEEREAAAAVAATETETETETGPRPRLRLRPSPRLRSRGARVSRPNPAAASGPPCRAGTRSCSAGRASSPARAFAARLVPTFRWPGVGSGRRSSRSRNRGRSCRSARRTPGPAASGPP